MADEWFQHDDGLFLFTAGFGKAVVDTVYKAAVLADDRLLNGRATRTALLDSEKFYEKTAPNFG